MMARLRRMRNRAVALFLGEALVLRVRPGLGRLLGVLAALLVVHGDPVERHSSPSSVRAWLLPDDSPDCDARYCPASADSFTSSTLAAVAGYFDQSTG